MNRGASWLILVVSSVALTVLGLGALAGCGRESGAGPPPTIVPARSLAPGLGAGGAFCGQIGSQNAGPAFHNVYACTGSQPKDVFGYQSTELAYRFEWNEYGLAPLGGTGGSVVAALTGSPYHVPIASSGSSRQLPVPGDVISMWGPGLAAIGQAGVITDVTRLPGQGDFDVILMDESGSPDNHNLIRVRHWTWHLAWKAPYGFNHFAWAIQGQTLKLNGSARFAAGGLSITSTKPGVAGSAWLNDRVDLTRSFKTSFAVSLHNLVNGEPGDGLTFTIQNSSSPLTALGAPNGSLGYGGTASPSELCSGDSLPGIGHSVAVALDIFQDRACDPWNNIVAVIDGGRIGSVIAQAPTSMDLFGETFRAWITYGALPRTSAYT